MTYVLAYSKHGIYDVTSRYVKDYNLIEERRKPEDKEALSFLINFHLNDLRKHTDPEEICLLADRDKQELIDLSKVKVLKHEDAQKRISGSDQWKSERGE